jgi:hypothetical protein
MTNEIIISDEKTITLLKPIRIGRAENAVVYDTLNLKEPTAGQLRKALLIEDDIGTLMSLIHQTAAVPMQVVESLSQRDLGDCQSFFLQFSSATPRALATSLLNAPSPTDGDQVTFGA